MINQRAVSDVMSKTWHRNRTIGDIFCCFCRRTADCPARKDLLEGRRAPATLRKDKKNRWRQEKGLEFGGFFFMKLEVLNMKSYFRLFQVNYFTPFM